MRQATATHVSTLRDYLQVARRRKWIILQAAVIVPLAALAFSLHQQSQFRGSSQVLLSQQDLSSQLTGASTSTNDPADRQAQTQASLARVPDVAQGAIARVHAAISPTAFLASSSVTAGTNSDILTFAVTNHDPALAARLATAYAHAYVTYRLAQDTAPINTALKEVQSQIATLPTHGALYTSLEDKATQLRTLAALKSANASVVQQSQTAVQTAPKTVRNVILGLVLGLFLGVGLAYAYVAYRVGDGPDAEDITAATFERALRYRAAFDPKRGEPVAWLIGIARREISTHYMGAPVVMHELPDTEVRGDFAEGSAERLDLRAALAELDDRDRELVALRYGADLTARQIGELLELKTNAVEVALHRALRRLRDRLATGEAAADDPGARPAAVRKTTFPLVFPQNDGRQP